MLTSTEKQFGIAETAERTRCQFGPMGGGGKRDILYVGEDKEAPQVVRDILYVGEIFFTWARVAPSERGRFRLLYGLPESPAKAGGREFRPGQGRAIA